MTDATPKPFEMPGSAASATEGAAVRRRQPGHGAMSPFRYLDIYRASPADHIRIIRDGVPASKAKRMIADLHFEQSVLLGALNLKTATVNRKAARDEALSSEDGERVIGMARLVGPLEAMLKESGAGPFDAPAWLSRWLREPLASLGGVRPASLLDTMEGQALVSRALTQIQSGAYA